MKIRESPQNLRVLPLFPKILTKSQVSYLSMNQRSPSLHLYTQQHKRSLQRYLFKSYHVQA